MVKAAVVQAAPVLFDREKTLDKAERLVGEARASGAELVVFPEAFVPAYPRGLRFGMDVGRRTDEGRKTWQVYWEQAVEVPGPATERLGTMARDASAFLVMGVIERDPSGTLYCTILYFDASGALVGKHRKLKPTAAERLIWGDGDGSTLTAIDTEHGRVGGLICWENYMPLARMAMYSKGVEFYVAPTADARDTWQATMRHVALEGRCFVLGCNQYTTKSMYPSDLPSASELEGLPEVLCRGGSVIVSPLGEVLAGPLYDEEGILTAELDRGEIARAKLDFDVMGHYARPDVFKLEVNERPARSVTHETDSA